MFTQRKLKTNWERKSSKLRTKRGFASRDASKFRNTWNFFQMLKINDFITLTLKFMDEN